MVSIMSLWLPIFLAAVFVFVISSIIHMLLPWDRERTIWLYSALPERLLLSATLWPYGRILSGLNVNGVQI